MLSNVMQEIRIAIYAVPAQIFEITWMSLSFPDTIIHSSSLCFPGAHILGSPFRLNVLPSVPSPLSIQLVDVPCHIEAGEQFSVRLWAGDTYNNSVPGISSKLVLTLKAPKAYSSRSIVVPVQESFHGPSHPRALIKPYSSGSRSVGYSALFPATTKIGTHSMFASLAIVGGLSATYYGNSQLEFPVLSDQPSTVDFSGMDVRQVLNITQYDSYESYSIRWVGLIRPESSDLYSLSTHQQSQSERVRLWLDHSLILDQWSSLAGLSRSATVDFSDAQSFFNIHLEYKQLNGSVPSGMQLMWSGTNVSIRVVPSCRLAESIQVLGSPQDINIHGGPIDAPMSTLFGPCTSLATSGLSCTFTIRIVDRFGLNVSPDGGVEAWSLDTASGYSNAIEINYCPAAGECILSFTPLSVGSTLLAVQYYDGRWNSRLHFKGSPSIVNVLAQGSLVENFVVFGSGLTVSTAGSPTFVSLLTERILTYFYI